MTGIPASHVMQIVVALLLLAIYGLVRPGWRQSGPFLPDAFLLGLLFYAGGASWIRVFEPLPASGQVAAMAWIALASGAAGAIAYCLFGRGRPQGEFIQFIRHLDSGPLEQSIVLAGLALSTVASMLFVYLVIRSDVLAALLGIGSMAGDANLLEARVAIASGSDAYLAPGYFKQFRDILMPILLASTVVLDRGNLKRPLFWICFLAAAIAIVISGQRLVVVVFLLTIVFASHYARRARQASRDPVARSRFPVTLLALVVAGYGLLTALLGRLRTDLTAIEAAIGVAGNFLDRVFLAAPRENAITHAVWSGLGPTGGTSWWNDLSGILPGVGENLSNVLHMAAGGSAAGNSPLGLAPDVWLAWGWPGLLLIPALFAIATGLLDFACSLRRSPVLAGTRFHLFLMLPVCYSPFMFLLYGGVVALGLIVLIVALRPPARVQQAQTAP